MPLQVKTFYAAENDGKKTVAQIEEQANTFLKELSPYNKVISIHPTMVDFPETSEAFAYTACAVMIVYEANE